MTDYQPIACGRYEALELAILRGQWLRLRLADRAEVLLGLPVDIGADQGAEWLRLREASGTEHRLRLDRIGDATPADAPSRAEPEPDW
jgi:transcriptional antiterminator Rof (Rho-off)